MRKTRKYPNMFGSIRKYKKDLRFAKRFSAWQKTVFPKQRDQCVSEPICINPNLQ